MRRARIRAAALPAIAGILAACSTHNTGTLPVAKHTAAAKATFILRVPIAGTAVNGRHGQYISPATQAVSINAQNFNVTASSPNCVTQSSALTCSFTVDAPNLGFASFTVTTYDQPLTAAGSVQGNQLSTGFATTNIVAGTQNTVKVTTDGIPAKASFSIAEATPPMGTAVHIPVTFSVEDADGYSIIGAYTVPFVLNAASPTSGPSLVFLDNGLDSSEANIWSSNDVIAIDYPGHFVAATTVVGTLNNKTMESVAFAPQPAYGAQTTVNTSLSGAEAYRDTNAPVTTYFTEPAKHSFGTMQSGTAITEFATPSGGTPLHLTHTVFPEGVQFTEDNGYIGTMGLGMTSSSLAISDSKVPTASSTPGLYQTASFGLGGTVAVSEYDTGKIAEDVNEGDPLAGGKGYVWTEYATGKANSTPAGIVGVSGGFEFADPGANAIGFIDGTTNAFTYYPVPTAGAHPTAIGYDDNGTLWFTEPGVNKVGKIDANNAITEYACGGSPIAIVVEYQSGPEVLTSAGKIDIYNVDGTYKEYTPPSSSSGPVVGIGDGGLGDVILLRSNGTTGAIQDFYYM